MAFYTIEATGHRGIIRMLAPLTASQAYTRTVALKRQGFINITAINTTTKRRITQVERLLRDLER